jgi:molybdate transport system permease protein
VRSGSGTRRRARTRVPPLIVVFSALSVAFFALPLVGLLQRTPWAELPAELARPEVLEALRLSVVASVGAVTLSVVFGVPLAWVLARVEFPGRNLVRALTTLPMVLPPVVGGIALLLAFGRRGLAGRWLDAWFGLSIPFTTLAAVLAATFVAMPFFVLTVEAGLRGLDHRLEDAAATLGASRWRVLFRVTLPLVAPSLGAGAALCWVRALGEFGATITFAGNLPGATQTMPLAAYLALETRTEGAVALSLILLAFSLAVLVAFRERLFAPR